MKISLDKFAKMLYNTINVLINAMMENSSFCSLFKRVCGGCEQIGRFSEITFRSFLPEISVGLVG